MLLQRCMGFAEKIVVGRISVKVMHSGKVMSDCTVCMHFPEIFFKVIETHYRLSCSRVRFLKC